jgi:hypothetical protein
MPTVTIKLPALHAGQRQIKAEAKRWNCCVAGRRFGKDVLADELAVDPLLDGAPVGWFEPTYKTLKVSWDALRSILQPVARRVSETEKRIELVTGGVLDYWTLEDVDAGRGRKYQRVIINEAGLSAKLGEIWNNAIRPTLTDLKGDAWFLGTPKGRNTFHALFTRGKDPIETDWQAWQMPTSANPFIDPAEIEAARRQMPDRAFRQEYLAEFLQDGGGVFRGVRDVVEPGRVAFSPKMAGRSYTMGVDLARLEDFTVFAVLDDTGNQVYHDRMQLVSWDRQVGRIVDVAGIYQAALYIDATSIGDPVCEAVEREAQRRGLTLTIEPYTFTGPSKKILMDTLAISIEQKRIALMDLAIQTNELEAYTYIMTPGGNVKMSAPEGLHDDCVCALALAEYGRQQEVNGVAPGIRGVGDYERKVEFNYLEEGWVEA